MPRCQIAQSLGHLNDKTKTWDSNHGSGQSSGGVVSHHTHSLMIQRCLGKCLLPAFYLFDFLTPFSATRLSCGWVPRPTSANFSWCTQRLSRETMNSVSAAHIILTPTQPVRKEHGDRTHDLLTRSRAL